MGKGFVTISRELIEKRTVKIGLDFGSTDLSGQDLSHTAYYKCNFRGANLDYCNLENVSFEDCNFIDASMNNMIFNEHSRFHNCIMMSLEYRIIAHSNIVRLNRNDVILDNGYLYVNFDRISVLHDFSGDVIGYKFCEPVSGFDLIGKYPNYLIVKLRIPAEARRILIKEGKCRAEYAYVEDIVDSDGNHVNYAVSCLHHLTVIKYEVGQKVTANKFDDDPMHECTNGIHFFLTEDEVHNFAFEMFYKTWKSKHPYRYLVEDNGYYVKEYFDWWDDCEAWYAL